jgi:hypothetical protein
MGKRKDPKGFIERARQKGLEKDTSHINNSVVLCEVLNGRVLRKQQVVWNKGRVTLDK